jgi:cytochrome P450
MSSLLESMFRKCFGSRGKPFEGIPGPAPIFPLGNLLDLAGPSSWNVCAEYEKKYGGLTLIWVGGRPTLVLNDPELIYEVMVTHWEDYYKDDPIKALKPTLRNSLFVLNPPEWTPLRQAYPHLQAGVDQWLRGQVNVIRKVVEKHVQRLAAAPGEVDLLDRMQRMIFEAFNACVVGRDLGDEGYHQFYVTSNTATFRMQLPDWMLVGPINPWHWKAMRLHYGAFEKIIAEARKNIEAEPDTLLKLTLQRGTTVSDEQLATFLANTQAGGNFSSGTALVNTFYLLNHNPDVANPFYAQLRDFIKGVPEFDAAKLDGFSPVNHVLRESLRCIAPVPIWFRNVLKTKAAQLDKYTLPPDTVLFILTRGIHQSPKYWRNPEKFDPSRWENGPVPADVLDHNIWFPFGRGPRMCPGASFALFCMRVMLVTMLSRYRVEMDTRQPYREFFHCGVAEPRGLKGRFVPH